MFLIVVHVLKKQDDAINQFSFKYVLIKKYPDNLFIQLVYKKALTTLKPENRALKNWKIY